MPSILVAFAQAAQFRSHAKFDFEGLDQQHFTLSSRCHTTSRPTHAVRSAMCGARSLRVDELGFSLVSPTGKQFCGSVFHLEDAAASFAVIQSGENAEDPSGRFWVVIR